MVGTKKKSPKEGVAVGDATTAAAVRVVALLAAHFPDFAKPREDDVATIRQIAGGTSRLTIELIIASNVLPGPRAIAATFWLFSRGELPADVLMRAGSPAPSPRNQANTHNPNPSACHGKEERAFRFHRKVATRVRSSSGDALARGRGMTINV